MKTFITFASLLLIACSGAGVQDVLNGSDGKDGINGRDGANGEAGPPGIPGEEFKLSDGLQTAHLDVLI